MFKKKNNNNKTKGRKLPLKLDWIEKCACSHQFQITACLVVGTKKTKAKRKSDGLIYSHELVNVKLLNLDFSKQGVGTLLIGDLASRQFLCRI